jgi:hypothetical protein
MARLVPLSLALLAACSQSDHAPSEGDPTASPATVRSPETGAGEQDDPRSRYTRLSACTLLRSTPEEAGFTEHECRGEGGYRFRLTESDLRQNIVVLTPGGGERSLELPVLANGAFSSVGDTIEWRGEAVGAVFAPRAMIVRHSVREDPDPAVPETAYLVVARLEPFPCVVARITPGPDQNRLAREAADRDRACLPAPAG